MDINEDVNTFLGEMDNCVEVSTFTACRNCCNLTNLLIVIGDVHMPVKLLHPKMYIEKLVKHILT